MILFRKEPSNWVTPSFNGGTSELYEKVSNHKIAIKLAYFCIIGLTIVFYSMKQIIFNISRRNKIPAPILSNQKGPCIFFSMPLLSVYFFSQSELVYLEVSDLK